MNVCYAAVAHCCDRLVCRRSGKLSEEYLTTTRCNRTFGLERLAVYIFLSSSKRPYTPKCWETIALQCGIMSGSNFESS